MTAKARIRALRSQVDAWFSAPEPNAAGRAGLFRILYALFYLWHLSVFDLAAVAGLPPARRSPLLLLAPLPADFPPVAFASSDALLVALLTLLAFGWRTRAVTVAVLLAGTLRETWLASVAVENGNVFLVFYIPLFMAVVGGWGDCYSIDALARRQRGAPTVAPGDNDARYFLAARAALVVLVALFVTSPLFKSFSGGTWLEQPDLLANLMLKKSVRATTLGLQPNPLAPFLAAHPLAHVPLQWGVLLFEGLFFLALFGRSLRTLFLSTALVFHAANAFLMMVTFTPVLAVYAMFPDWERLWGRFGAARFARGTAPPWRLAAGGALLLALGLAAGWRSGASSLFNLVGLVNWQTPFYAIGPIAAFCAVRELGRLVGALPQRETDSG